MSLILAGSIAEAIAVAQKFVAENGLNNSNTELVPMEIVDRGYSQGSDESAIIAKIVVNTSLRTFIWHFTVREPLSNVLFHSGLMAVPGFGC